MHLFLLGVLTAFAGVSSSSPSQPTRTLRQTRSSSIGHGGLTPRKLEEGSIKLYINEPWENFLIPAPTAIALLGGITVLSAKVDFSLNESIPKGGFKHVRQPGSFSASLIQVGNDGWSAFNTAHRNMDAIQLDMLQIPVYVKIVLRMVQGAPAERFQQLIKAPLTRIIATGNRCVQLSTETEERFLDLMLLLGEILLSTIHSKGVDERRLQEVQQLLSTSTVEKESLTKLGQGLSNREKEANDAIESKREAYQKAVEAIPRGANLFFQNFFAGESFKDSKRALLSLSDLSRGRAGQGRALLNSTQTHDNNNEYASVFARSFFHTLQSLRDTLGQIFNGTYKVDSLSGLQSFRERFANCKESLARYNTSQVAVNVLASLPAVTSFLAEIIERASALSSFTSKPDKDQITSQIDGLIAQANLSFSVNMPATTKPRGHPSASGECPGNGLSAPGQVETYQACLRMQELTSAHERSFQIYRHMQIQQNELHLQLRKIKQLDLQAASFKEISGLMADAIVALSKISQQWSSLTKFFSKVAVEANFTLTQVMTPFLKNMGQLQADSTYEEGNYILKELLRPLVNKIHTDTFSLHVLTKTYVEISQGYILDPLGKLANLLLLQPSQRSTALDALEKTSMNSTIFINRIADEKRMHCVRKVQEMLQINQQKEEEIQVPNQSGNMNSVGWQQPQPEMGGFEVS